MSFLAQRFVNIWFSNVPALNIPDAVTQTRIVRAKLDIYVFIAILYIHCMWVCLCVCVLQKSSDGV